MAAQKFDPTHRIGFALAALSTANLSHIAGDLTDKEFLKAAKVPLAQLSKGVEQIRRRAKK